MKIIKYSAIIAFVALTLVAIFAFVMPSYNAAHSDENQYSIEKIWKLPKALKEISGITWLSEKTIAAVQDEDGILFIYDLEKSEIIEEIRFAGSGDYEGIAINNEDAYVMRSDGLLFEIVRFREEDKNVSKFQTPFSEKNDIESLTLDAKKHHLITIPKEIGLKDDTIKGLYHIPIDSMKMNIAPKIRINMNDDAFKKHKKRKIHETFNPSDVAIHPKTGEYYVIEGTRPKLVILAVDGTIKNVIKLDSDNFPQPEGITFSPEGTLYISTEAGGGKAAIMEVVLDLF